MESQYGSQRVRAILLDSSANLILIKRIKPHLLPYWVAPGGGVEATDISIEAALKRELWEELGATVEIGRLVLELNPEHDQNTDIKQSFFLCHLITMNPENKMEPEFSDPTRGKYIIETIPLNMDSLKPLNILPVALKDFLLDFDVIS